MRVGAVSSSAIATDRYRLTGAYHLAEDQQAMRLLDKVASGAKPLESLCTGRRVFRGPIFTRSYAADSSHGRPYVSPAELERADFRPNRFLSTRHGNLLNELELRSGMVLVTCSGMNLGRAIWANTSMDGLCASHDLIRIEVDESKVPPGYVYAFLSSRFGKNAIRRQIYGGNIKHIEPHHVGQLAIPRLSERQERKAHESVLTAADNRARFQHLIAEATALLFDAAGLPTLSAADWRGEGPELGFEAEVGIGRTLRASNYSPRVGRFVAQLTRLPHKTLGQICEGGHLGTGARFKRVDCDPELGVRLVGQKHGFWMRPEGRWISPRHAPKDIFARDESVLVASSGTLGEQELYCRALLVTGRWLDYAYTQHFLRVVSGDPGISGAYLFAFFRSELLFRVMRAYSTGSKQQEVHLDWLSRLPVPVLDNEVRSRVEEKVRSAHVLRDEADDAEDAAVGIVEKAIEEAA